MHMDRVNARGPGWLQALAIYREPRMIAMLFLGFSSGLPFYPAFQTMTIWLRESGIAASMGSVGDCYDNAMAESFFATLETELIDRSDWASPAEARAAVFEYIEVFYNRIRRHSSLGNQSPEQFEENYRSSPAVRAM